MLWKLEISSCIDGPVMLYTDLSFTSTATKVKSAFINILIHNTHCTAQKMEVIGKIITRHLKIVLMIHVLRLRLGNVRAVSWVFIIF